MQQQTDQQQQGQNRNRSNRANRRQRRDKTVSKIQTPGLGGAVRELLRKGHTPPVAGGSKGYWQRERSAVGRVINDVADFGKRAVGRMAFAMQRPTIRSRGLYQAAVADYRADKTNWRKRFRETGRLDTGAEVPIAPKPAQNRAQKAQIAPTTTQSGIQQTVWKLAQEAGRGHAETRQQGQQKAPAKTM